MAALTGAALTAGVALYGASEQKKASKAANAATMGQAATAQAFLAQGQQNALGAQNKGIKGMEQSFDRASGAVGMMGEASRGRATRRGAQQLAAADAMSLNRGLGGSSQNDASRRGVHADINNAMANIDESVAGMLSQVHQGRARARLAGYSGLASIYQGFAPQQAKVAMTNQHQSANVAGGLSQAAGSITKLLQMYGAPPTESELSYAQGAAIGQVGAYGAQMAGNAAMGLFGFNATGDPSLSGPPGYGHNGTNMGPSHY